MTTGDPKARAREAVIQPFDVVAGLGAADRAFLAACIALFEDTTLSARLERWVDEACDAARDQLSKWRDAPAAAAASANVVRSIQSRAQQWLGSGFSDTQLRLVLWIYLRDAFDLPARTCISTRAAMSICDDLIAHLLHAIGPDWWQHLKSWVGISPSPQPATLDSVARQTMEEMLRHMLDSEDAASVEARAQLMAGVRERVQRLDHADRAALLEAIGADQLNDAALRTILLTGGGLTAFSVSVGAAGFSAYIFAAQVSAFIPLVSGPALVSLVAVLSNPVTVIALIAGGSWWSARNARQKVRAQVAARVIALLAMNGLTAGASGLRATAAAFHETPLLAPFGDLDDKAIRRYQQDWQSLEPAWPVGLIAQPALVNLMDRPARDASAPRFEKMLDASKEDWQDTAALSVLTLGDIVYQSFAIDPTVMEAADFSHVADLGNVVDFAAFADRIEALDPAATLGAVSELKGYVAERLVAVQLVQQGHQVSFPDASNQAGWDIRVDGISVQIKDTDSIQYLGEHFAKYGDQYPVIVNSEMAQKLADHHEAWINHVYFVEGYSNQVVQQVTESSLHAGAAMDHPHVPAFTLIISALRNCGRYTRGEVTGVQALEQFLLDGGTKMTLAVAGGYVGPALGLLLFGPAGALVLGAVAPIVSQMQSSKLQQLLDAHVSSDAYRSWSGEVCRALAALAQTSRKALQTKAELLKRQADAAPAGEVGDYLRWRLQDELAYLRESWCRLNAILDDKASSTEMVVANLLRWLAGSSVHPTAYQRELKALSDLFKARPSLGDRGTDYGKEGADALRTSVLEFWSWLGRRKA